MKEFSYTRTMKTSASKESPPSHRPSWQSQYHKSGSCSSSSPSSLLCTNPSWASDLRLPVLFTSSAWSLTLGLLFTAALLSSTTYLLKPPSSELLGPSDMQSKELQLLLRESLSSSEIPDFCRWSNPYLLLSGVFNLEGKSTLVSMAAREKSNQKKVPAAISHFLMKVWIIF